MAALTWAGAKRLSRARPTYSLVDPVVGIAQTEAKAMAFFVSVRASPSATISSVSDFLKLALACRWKRLLRQHTRCL